MNFVRLYRAILSLYPARFRDDYRDELDLAFRMELEETAGFGARSRFLWRTGWDIACSLPAQLLREFGQDLRYAVRVNSRTPLRSTVTVLVLALALGVCSGVFSVVNALLVRPLPFQEADRLMQLYLYPRGAGEDASSFHHWREQNRYLKDAASFAVSPANVSTRDGSARVITAEVSSNFFDLLGVQPQLGRGFAAGEDMKGSNRVAVVGYGFWQQDLGGDPRAVGSEILISGTPFLVVGVAAPGFDYPTRATLWTPTVFDWELIPKTGVTHWERIGRLADGISFSAAESLYEKEVHELSPGMVTDAANRQRLIPLQHHLAGRVKSASIALLVGVGLVLLVAGANTVGLLITRVFERQKELGLRLAMGASRARITQQLMTESVGLAVLSAVPGLLIGHWVCQVAALSHGAALEIQRYSVLDWRVIGVVASISLLLTVVCGFLPARILANTSASGCLDGIRRLRSGVVQQGMLSVQIALSVALLAGSFLVGMACLDLSRTDMGFSQEQLVTMSVSLAGTKVAAKDDRIHYYREALERLNSIPGVVAAAGAEYLPLTASAFSGGRFHMGDPSRAEVAVVLPVTEGYFRTLGAPLLHGREFATGEWSSEDRVVVVSETLAKKWGDPSRVVGMRLSSVGTNQTFTIVGVAKEQKLTGPAGGAPPQVFVPISQRTPGQITFVARLQGDSNHLALRCRDVLQSIEQEVPVFDLQSMDDRVAASLNEPRFFAVSMNFFGAFVLLLALMGAYGIAHAVVARRKREIGVRLALGSTPAALRLLLVARAAPPIVVGLIGGTLITLMLAPVLRHLVERSGPVDIQTTACIAATIGVASFVAMWQATVAVTRNAPLSILKSE